MRKKIWGRLLAFFCAMILIVQISPAPILAGEGGAAPSLVLTPDTVTFMEGGTGTDLEQVVDVTVMDDDEIIEDIQAESSDDSLFEAEIRDSGSGYTLFIQAKTGIVAGNTGLITVKALDSGQNIVASETLPVDVQAAPVATAPVLVLDKDSITFMEGATGADLQTSVTITVEDEDEVVDAVRAQSDDPLFDAQITASGGNYVLTVTADDGIVAGDGAAITLEALDAGQNVAASETLTVHVEELPADAPVISGLSANYSLYADDGPGEISFTVRDSNTPPLAITSVTAASDDPSLLAITQQPLAQGADDVYTMEWEPGGAGTVTVTVEAANAKGKTTERQVTVTMEASLAAPAFDDELETEIWETEEDTAVVIDLADYILDTDTIGTLRLAANAATNGEAALSGTEITFTPEDDHYTPAGEDYSATVDVLLTYRKGGAEQQAAGQVKIKVLPEEDAPVAKDDSFTGTTTDDAIVILIEDILENDTTAELEGVAFVSFGTPVHVPSGVYNGSVRMSDDELSLQYTPNVRYPGGEVTILYTIKNKDGVLTDEAKIILTLEKGSNLAPEIEAPADIMAQEDEDAYTFTFKVSDKDIADLDDLSVTVKSSDQAILKDENILFEPEEDLDSDTRVYTVTLAFEPDANGDFYLELEAGDGEDTTLLEIPVTVEPVNDPPEFDAPEEITAREDADEPYSFTFTVSDRDIADLDDLSVTIKSGNQAILKDENIDIKNIEEDLNNENTLIYTVELTFEPDAYTSVRYGELELLLEAEDEEDTTSLEIPVTVEAVNDAPEIIVDADSISAGATMEEQSDGTFQVTMQEDSTATFTFTVTDVDLPLKNDGTPDFSGYKVKIESSDDDYTVFASTGFRAGTALAEDDTTLTYTVTIAPKANANTQQDEYLQEDVVFTLWVEDEQGEHTERQTLQVKVEQVNDDPQARNDAYSIDKDDVCLFDVLSNDEDHDGHATIKIIAVQNLSELDGTVTIAQDGRKIEYVPAKHVVGTDQFTYTIEDDQGWQSTATVTVDIAFVNHRPEFIGLNEDAPYEMDEDEENFQITFSVYDDTVLVGDIDTVVVATGNSNLIADIDVLPVDPGEPGERVLQVTHAQDKNSYGGQDVTIKVTISDGEHLVDKYITLHIRPVNDAPKAVGVSGKYIEGQADTVIAAATILSRCSDIDTGEDDVIYLQSVDIDDTSFGDIANVERALIPGTTDQYYITQFTYQVPSEYFDEPVPIAFTIRDKAGETGSATLTLNPEKKNDDPIFRQIIDTDIVMDEDGEWMLPITFKDPEKARDKLTIDIVSTNEEVVGKSNISYEIREDEPGQDGMLDFTGGANLTIRPRKDQFSATPFDVVITISDGENSVSQTISLTVRPVPDKPVAPEQEFSTMEATALTFNPLLDVTDVDPGDTFELHEMVFVGGKDDDGTGVNSLPGTLVIDKVTGKCVFTPEATFVGTLTFDYTVRDSYDGNYAYGEAFVGYPNYPDVTVAGQIYEGMSTGELVIVVGQSSVGPSLRRLSPIVAYAGQTMPTRDLQAKNVNAGNSYTISAEVLGGGPVDPASITIDGAALPQDFTAEMSNPAYELDFNLKPGAVGQSIVRFTITSTVNGEPNVNTMSFTVTTHAENLPPTLRSPVVVEEVYPERVNGSYNTIEIDVMDLANIIDPESQGLTFGTISTSGLGGDEVRVKPKGDGTYVLEYRISDGRSARVNENMPDEGIHKITFNYTVFDEGGKAGIQVDENDDPVLDNNGDTIPYGTITISIKAENHAPEAWGYIFVAEWDGDDIVLNRTGGAGSWGGHTRDIDTDTRYLQRAWYNPGENGETGEIQEITIEGAEQDKADTIRFTPTTEDGWVSIHYQVWSQFKDDTSADKDYSPATGGLIHIYIPPKNGEFSMIPPKASSGWRAHDEDEQGTAYVTEDGYIREEITSWLFGDGSQYGNPNLDIKITSFDEAGDNNEDGYKIVDARAVKEAIEISPGVYEYHYYIEYKQAPNANSYIDANGDLTDSLAHPIIRFQIKNTNDTSPGAPTANGSFTARITSVNDAPQIAPDSVSVDYFFRPDRLAPEEPGHVEGVPDATGVIRAELTMERGTDAEMRLKITDPDYPTQSKCNGQINLSVFSSNDLVIVSNKSVVLRPEGDSEEWVIRFSGFLPGETTLTVKVYDESGAVSENIIEIDIEVTGENKDPVAFDHYGVFDEDNKAAVKVFYEDSTEDDSDPDGDPLTIQLITTEHPNGAVSVDGDKIIFIPNNDFCHTASLAKNDGAKGAPDNYEAGQWIEIQFRLEDEVSGDNKGVSQDKTLYLHFNPVNDAPRFIGVRTEQEVHEVNPKSTQTYGEVTVTITDVDNFDFDIDNFVCSFAENDPVFAQDAAVIHSVTKNVDDSFTVVIHVSPNLYQCHEDDDTPSPLTITATDAGGQAASTVVGVNVRPANDAPMFKGKDDPLFGEPLYSDPLWMQLDDPEAPLQTNEDEPITIDLPAYFVDPDNDAINILSLPPGDAVNGTIQYNDNKAVFTPDEDYFTPEEDQSGYNARWGSFTYTLTDGVSGTVYILINPVNDAPTVKNKTYTTEEDTELAITDLFAGTYNASATVFDVDNDREELSLASVGSAGLTEQGGTVTIRPNSDDNDWEIVYVPKEDFSGTDAFSYTVTDGDRTATGKITVTVTPSDDAPRANFQGSGNWAANARIDIGDLERPTWTMQEDVPQTFSYSAWDPENKNITVVIEAVDLEAGSGNCTVLNDLLPKDGIKPVGSDLTRSVELVPCENMYGSFTLRFTISDGKETSVYFIPVQVQPVNDIPQISDKNEETLENTALTGSIQATDVETAAGNLLYALDPDKPEPARGAVVVGDDGSYVYTPTASYFGEDSFWIQVTDRGALDNGENNGAASAQIKVKITPVNDAPGQPADLAVTGNDAYHYKGGDTIALEWTGAEDLFNETKPRDMAYNAQYSLDGANWTDFILADVQTPDGGANWTGTVPASVTAGLNTDTFRVRIQAKDDGRAYEHTGDVASDDQLITGAPLVSGWVVSADVVKIDSAFPDISHRPATLNWTNEDVNLTLVADPGTLAGASEIAKIQVLVGSVYEDLDLDGNEAAYIVSKNGIYSFRVYDAVGNFKDYTIIIDKIDRVQPVATLTQDNANGKTMTQSPHVLLEANDPAPGAGDELTDVVSGVKTTQYQFVPQGEELSDTGWLTSTGGRADVPAKGTYVLWTRTVDNAGNVNIQNQGSLTVENAVPVVEDAAVTLYEHPVGANKSQLTLTLPASDDDAGDTLTYLLESGAAYTTLLQYVKLEEGQSAGTYVFTHEGGHVPDADTQIDLTYHVNDGAADSADAVIRVTLVRVNDVPGAPDSLAVTSPKDCYTAGDTLDLEWPQGDDEETPDSALRYDVGYLVNGASWGAVTTVNTLSHVAGAPSGVSGTFYLQVRTRDDNGNTYINRDGGTGDATSGWVKVGPFDLDNAKPTATHTIVPDTENPGYAIVTIVPADGSETWQSGVASITRPADAELLSGSEYIYRVPTTGTITFPVADQVGNVNDYVVDARAPADPVIEYDVEFTKKADGFIVTWTHASGDTTGHYYELQVSYDGGQNWTDVRAKAAGYTALEHTFTVPGTAPDTDEMLFRLRAWDSKGLPSGWDEGHLILCDSTAPVIAFTADPDTLISGDVDVYCQVTDPLAGVSALEEDRAGSYSGAPPADDNRIFDYNTVYTFEENGTVTVTATDRCGNVAIKTFAVNHIDKEKPALSVTAASNGLPKEEGDSANYPYTFTLVFEDVGVAGLAGMKYAVNTSDTPPATDDGWTVTDKTTVTARESDIADYYVHMYAIDEAGNEITQTFGPYHIINTIPKAKSFTASVWEGGSVLIQLEGEDEDPGDFITEFTIVAAPAFSQSFLPVDGVPGLYEYVHDGEDPISNTSFTYTVKDDRGGVSEEATVTIRVLEINDPPQVTAREPAVTMFWNDTLETELDVFDPDDLFSDQRISFRSSDSGIIPENRIRMAREADSDDRAGVLKLVFEPVPGRYTELNPVRITVTVRDPAGLIDTATIDVTIEPSPLAPEAADQYYFVMSEGRVADEVRAEPGFMADTLEYGFDITQYDTTLGAFSYGSDPADAGFQFEADASFSEGAEVDIPVTITQKNLESHGDLETEIELRFRSEAVTFENRESDVVFTILPADVFPVSFDAADVRISTSDSSLLKAGECHLEVGSSGEIYLYYRHEPYRYGQVDVTLTLDSGEEVTIPIVILPINDPPDVEMDSQPIQAVTTFAVADAFSMVTGLASRMTAFSLVETMSAPVESTQESVDLIVGQALAGSFLADDSKDHQPNDSAKYNDSYQCRQFGFAMIVPPEHGTLELDEVSGEFSYQPDAGYIGTDLFSVLISEQEGHEDNQNPAVRPEGVFDVSETVPLLARAVDVSVTITPPKDPQPEDNTGGGDPGGQDPDPGSSSQSRPGGNGGGGFQYDPVDGGGSETPSASSAPGGNLSASVSGSASRPVNSSSAGSRSPSEGNGGPSLSERPVGGIGGGSSSPAPGSDPVASSSETGGRQPEFYAPPPQEALLAVPEPVEMPLDPGDDTDPFAQQAPGIETPEPYVAAPAAQSTAAQGRNAPVEADSPVVPDAIPDAMEGHPEAALEEEELLFAPEFSLETHQPEENPAPVRWIWLLGILLAAFLLLLLVFSTIRVHLSYMVDGEEKVKTLWRIRRIRYAREEELRFTIPKDVLPPETTRLRIHFGWFYRRRKFYERPILLRYGEMECHSAIPEKDVYKEDEKGLEVLAGAFVLIHAQTDAQ